MSKSTKFLPFVSNSSSELSIFKALVQRSKGSSTSTLTSLFSIIVNVGIENVRGYMDKLPAGMTNSEKTKELINTSPEYSISPLILDFWCCILENYRLKGIKELEPFSAEELGILFSSIAHFKPSSLPVIGINDDLSNLKDFIVMDTFNIKDLKHVKLSDSADAEKVEFFSYPEMLAFIAFKEHTKTNFVLNPLSTSTPKISVYTGNALTNITGDMITANTLSKDNPLGVASDFIRVDGITGIYTGDSV